jgi:hypothetical protein
VLPRPVLLRIKLVFWSELRLSGAPLLSVMPHFQGLVRSQVNHLRLRIRMQSHLLPTQRGDGHRLIALVQV